MWLLFLAHISNRPPACTYPPTHPSPAHPPALQAISGDKLPDKSQGPLTGMLKDMGYTEEQVFKF